MSINRSSAEATINFLVSDEIAKAVRQVFMVHV